MSKKLEKEYKRSNEELNDAISKKDYAKYDREMAIKLCLDTHVFGKN
jgi:hypothetical protein